MPARSGSGQNDGFSCRHGSFSCRNGSFAGSLFFFPEYLVFLPGWLFRAGMHGCNFGPIILARKPVFSRRNKTPFFRASTSGFLAGMRLHLHAGIFGCRHGFGLARMIRILAGMALFLAGMTSCLAGFLYISSGIPVVCPGWLFLAGMHGGNFGPVLTQVWTL